MSLDDCRVCLQPAAAFNLDLFQLVKRGEDPIGQRLVGKRPEPLRGLHLWGIRRQEHQVDPLWQFESCTAVPASPIQHEHNVFVWPCSHPPLANAAKAREKISTLTVGTSSQLVRPLCGCDICKDIHPFVALGHRGFDRGSFGCPDAAQNRFEADAMLIHGPRLDAGVGILVLHQSHLLRQFF